MAVDKPRDESEGKGPRSLPIAFAPPDDEHKTSEAVKAHRDSKILSCPREVRNLIYTYLVHDITSNYPQPVNHSATLAPHQRRAKAQARKIASASFLNYALVCSQMYREFEEVYMGTIIWSTRVGNCLAGPRAKPPMDARSQRVVLNARTWALKGRLVGTLAQDAAVDYAVGIRFTRAAPGGYTICWSHLSPSKKSNAKIAEDVYEAMVSRVELALGLAIDERERMDGKRGLTPEGVERIIDAFCFRE